MIYLKQQSHMSIAKLCGSITAGSKSLDNDLKSIEVLGEVQGPDQDRIPCTTLC